MTEYIAFAGSRLIARGGRAEIVRALGAEPGLAFDLETGAQVDFAPHAEDKEVAERGRGRPKLGVIAREVTLLPRHWDWLNAQRGGASAALRRLVDAARAADGGATQERQAKEAAYRILSALAGDWPRFEEAARALFADDLDGFRALTAEWPGDVAAVALERLGVLRGA